jgi:hypothetical protein
MILRGEPGFRKLFAAGGLATWREDEENEKKRPLTEANGR